MKTQNLFLGQFLSVKNLDFRPWTQVSTSTVIDRPSLLRAERNSNKCHWSTARKKNGPVNHPCDRPFKQST
jgi:hypothetical protein